MIVDMSPGHRISPSKGGATWQVTITKSAIPKEKTLAGVCLALLGASPLAPTDTPPPFSSRLSRCSHLDCRAAAWDQFGNTCRLDFVHPGGAREYVGEGKDYLSVRNASQKCADEAGLPLVDHIDPTQMRRARA